MLEHRLLEFDDEIQSNNEHEQLKGKYMWHGFAHSGLFQCLSNHDLVGCVRCYRSPYGRRFRNKPMMNHCLKKKQSLSYANRNLDNLCSRPSLKTFYKSSLFCSH